LHVTLCCILLLAAGAAFAQDNSLAIENEFLQARFDRATGRFSLTAKPSQHVFLRDGRFSNPGGAAKITNVADTRFGTAQAIESETPGGNRDALDSLHGYAVRAFETPVEKSRDRGDGAEPRRLSEHDQIQQSVIDARCRRHACAVPKLPGVRQVDEERAIDGDTVQAERAGRVPKHLTRRQARVGSKASPAARVVIETHGDVGVKAQSREVEEQSPTEFACINETWRRLERFSNRPLGMTADIELARQAISGSRRHDSQCGWAKDQR